MHARVQRAYSRTGVVPNVAVPAPLAGALSGGARQGDMLRGDLLVRAGRVTGLRPGDLSRNPRIVLPALVEPHCHLDKCHSIDRLDGVGGDLAAAIAAQATDKLRWTRADLRRRAARGLDELQAAGCALIRSHVDWGDGPEPPLAWHVLDDLARERPGLRLQRAPLFGMDLLADKARALVATRHVAEGGVLGGFVLGGAGNRGALRNAFALADRFDLALDFHVDEGLDPGLRGLELIAEIALETGFSGPILCGHAVSLMNRDGQALAALLDRLARAPITIAALPTTNLYLQGRTNGTPDRRGITRLRELSAAGVPVVVGSDNVRDAFCPLGRHDPMNALHLAVLTAHLDPPLARWLPLITHDAARALGQDAVPVAGARLDDLRLSTAPDLSTLIAGDTPPPSPLSHHLEPDPT